MSELIILLDDNEDAHWALEGIRKQIMAGYTSGEYQGISWYFTED